MIDNTMSYVNRNNFCLTLAVSHMTLAYSVGTKVTYLKTFSLLIYIRQRVKMVNSCIFYSGVLSTYKLNVRDHSARWRQMSIHS